jgi:glycosyltransferase involved in cell wall biosynthesis
LPLIRSFSSSKVLYYGHDLHFERLAMQARLTADEALENAAAESRKIEGHVWEQVDAIIYPSADETATVLKILPEANVHVVSPYAFENLKIDAFSPCNRSDTLFVAGFGHSPNVDAARWAVDAIMPSIWAVEPETKLFLVGSNPTDEILALSSSRVHVTGWVSDDELEAHYRDRRVALVPLRFGAGVKSKVVEALRHGIPLVTTPVGAQGLDDLSSVVTIADDPETIAAEIVKLLNDDAAWENASMIQTEYAIARFSQETLAQQLIYVIEGGHGSYR